MILVNLVTFTLRNNAAFIATRYLCRVTPYAYNKVVKCNSWLLVNATILDKSPWDSTEIFIFLGSLLKQCTLFEISYSSTFPHPMQSWNSEKILDTRVQHCLWGEGRGWTCVNWKTPQKCKCPKTSVHDCSFKPRYNPERLNCIVVLTYLADDQHLSDCFAAHVCSCDDIVLLTRIPSSYCFSRCQGYIFGASYKFFRCGVTNRHGGILNYLKTEPGEKVLLHFLNQFWNVKRLILFCSDCNGSQKLDGFAWEKKLLPPSHS